MKKVNVPKTDPHASALAHGTDYFGGTVGRDLSMQLMDRYLEAGGHGIDAAEVHARWVPGGEHHAGWNNRRVPPSQPAGLLARHRSPLVTLPAIRRMGHVIAAANGLSARNIFSIPTGALWLAL
jgi:hypothetical protein